MKDSDMEFKCPHCHYRELVEGGQVGEELTVEVWERIAMLRRADASVKACADISVKALSSGVVGEMVTILKAIDIFWEGNCQSDNEYHKLCDEVESILSKLEGNDG
jgi:hypothetical protein